MAVAVVLAGGSGSRMKSDVAKQYIKINDREVLYYPLYTFQNNENISRIILVTRESDIEFCKKDIVAKYNFDKVSDVIAGGKERYNSVYNGIVKFTEYSKSSDDDRVSDNDLESCDEIVLIHDGARPFVTDKMIDDAISTVKECGACTVGVPVKDTIKVVDENGFGVDTPDRKTLWQIQTPQGFKIKIIKEAYEAMFDEQKNNAGTNHNITDDTMLVELYKGVRSKVIFGAYENIKITTPEDVETAKIIVENFFKKN
ncbi:MAG: 2-C-methyl-D-erythritol 4-phosphate cytidylyltransferase [Lachnospiraceae bacterium]|nr:2-C-methyl-D-erythritol 4-phosphate cytidylyltransferase [Lachnospiraceae bacterium]